jgi:1,4-dihydroxy-2-naphthoyl-CoA hydrolase
MSMLKDIPHTGWVEALGLQVSHGEGGVSGSLSITPDLLDRTGRLHHGVLASMAETVASVAGAIQFLERGHVVGVSNTTDVFLAPTSGQLLATTSSVLIDADAQLWRVEIRDDADRLVASSHVRLANITSADTLGRPS